MRRILVPLDGSELASSILPDAQRYAGPDGEIVLIRDAGWSAYTPRGQYYKLGPAIEATDAYLEEQVGGLRRQGVRARAHRAVLFNPSAAVDEAALLMNIDMIACATHGRGVVGRFFHGNIAWKMLAHSPVPVLLRHPSVAAHNGQGDIEPSRRRILVPLDGSAFAETALPLARTLAVEWRAPIYLVRAVDGSVARDGSKVKWDLTFASVTDHAAEALAYLDQRADGMSIETHAEVLVGSPVVERIVEFVGANAITDVVLSSHGRTGVPRMLFGSVADGLIQHLHCPIVVVPALAVKALEREREQGIGAPAVTV